MLKLLSRFSLTSDQAKRFFNPDGRPDGVDDASVIENPYLLYELDRAAPDSIPVTTIDRGMLPGNAVLKAHPLPECSRLGNDFNDDLVAFGAEGLGARLGPFLRSNSAAPGGRRRG